ncbi:MAG: urease accessory protein UreF [Pseudomonadota bacterium]
MSEGALLSLIQWLWPAFPTGGFAWSHGLERAVEAGDVRDAETLGAWVGDVVARGSGALDAALLVQAMAPDADHAHLAELARALAASRERLAETVEQGAAFARTVAAVTGTAMPEAPLPVAVGRAAAPLGLAPAQVAAVYLHAFASNLILAGVRFIPLGQTEGQRALAALQPVIVATAARAVATAPDAIGSAAVGADLAAMEHEESPVRIFKS